MDELIPEWVQTYDGEYSGEYGVKRLLTRGGNSYCSTSGSNVDVEFKLPGPFRIFSMEVNGSPPNYTASMKDLVVFLCENYPNRDDYKRYDDLTLDNYEEITAMSTDMKKRPKSLPTAYIRVPNHGSTKKNFDRPHKARYVFIKFLRPWAGSNIDIDSVSFFGISAKRTVLVGVDNMQEKQASMQHLLQAAKIMGDEVALRKGGYTMTGLMETKGHEEWKSIATRTGMKPGHVARLRRVISKVRAFQIAEVVNSMPDDENEELALEHQDLLMQKDRLDISRMERARIYELWKQIACKKKEVMCTNPIANSSLKRAESKRESAKHMRPSTESKGSPPRDDSKPGRNSNSKKPSGMNEAKTGTTGKRPLSRKKEKTDRESRESKSAPDSSKSGAGGHVRSLINVFEKSGMESRGSS